MCGIAGKLGADGANHRDVVDQMVAMLHHRGPDNTGVEILDGGVCLGHTRLSIIDLDERSNQPLVDASGRYHIVYNGEVYNFRELREQLLVAGRTFATESDTEVVLNAYAEWGSDAFGRFNGMFALAIWDATDRTLVLARDRFGQKPLYYSTRGGGLSFASELTALMQDPGIRDGAKLSIAGLNHFFAMGYILAPHTMVADVCKLEPASYLVFKDGRIHQISRYWEYRDAFARRHAAPADRIAGELAELLDQAVARRLVSDVPVGSFLSGGIDSSAVVAFAKKHLPYDLHTFSVGFEAASYDESSDARMVAAHLDTIHHERFMSQGDGADLVDFAIDRFDELFADTSLVPMVEVARVASEHVKVVLSGDGADEILAGYLTYRADHIKRRMDILPGPLRRLAAALARRVTFAGNRKTGFAFKARQFAGGLGGDARYGHYAWRELHAEQERIALIGAEHAEEIRDSHPFQTFCRYYDEVRELDPLSQHLYVDAKTWLADDVLVKVDRSTMAWSIEARAPFLDIDLVDYVAGIPSEFKLRGSDGKHILKRALKPYLPASTLNKKKAGFNAPINAWLQNHDENEFRFFNKHVWRRKKSSLPPIACAKDV